MEFIMTKIKYLLGCAVATLSIFACQSEPSEPSELLYYGFTHIDPVTETVTPNSWVVIQGELILEMGSGKRPQGHDKQSVDMTGRYALPGFIDAHAHITAGPHKVALHDGAPMLTMESKDDITQFNARTALAFGITTARNPGASTAANYEYDQNIKNGNWIGPEVFHAGSILQPLPFGGSAFAHPKTPEEWDAEARHQADMGMKYFKLYVSLTEDEIAQGIKAAHKAGLKAIAHLDNVSWEKAAELGIDGLEHALPTSPELLEPDAKAAYLAEAGQNSTFMYRWFEQVDFSSPNFQKLVTGLVENQVELNFNFGVNYITYNGDKISELHKDWNVYFHPETLAAVESLRAMSMAGWTPEDYMRARAAFPKVLEFGKVLYDAGLPIMIGTDGPGGTPYYALEMGFHVQAGIPAWEVLRMATSSTAKILEISDRTGQIQAGFEADIVFLNANPLDDMENIAMVDTTLSNGKAYSFSDLAEVVD